MAQPTIEEILKDLTSWKDSESFLIVGSTLSGEILIADNCGLELVAHGPTLEKALRSFMVKLIKRQAPLGRLGWHGRVDWTSVMMEENRHELSQRS
jgi:hypothetical protein